MWKKFLMKPWYQVWTVIHRFSLPFQIFRSLYFATSFIINAQSPLVAAFKNVCCLAVSNERRLGVFRNTATLLKAFKPEYWSEAAVVFSRARVEWWEGEGVAEYNWVLARLSFLLHFYTVTMGVRQWALRVL